MRKLLIFSFPELWIIESNYCVKCTIEKVHNAHYNSETYIVRCEQIHKFPNNDDLSAFNTDNIENTEKDDTNSQMVVENSVEEEMCQCVKLNKDGNFKCNICGKYFCNLCPTGPVENNCVE